MQPKCLAPNGSGDGSVTSSSFADASSEGYVYAEAQWLDTLYVAGRAAGKPVTLRVTYVVDGDFRVSPNAAVDSNLTSIMVLKLTVPGNKCMTTSTLWRPSKLM
jgi:hypothetical protein